MPTALIAEDEPLLAQALRKALAQTWPELEIVASVGDGDAAVRQTLLLRPDVLFLDIRMPGRSGIEAAADIADQWEAGVDSGSDRDREGAPFPALVFITAYEQYAVQAFEAQAVDYLLKPLQPERLRMTVERLRALMALPQTTNEPGKPAHSRGPTIEQALDQLRQLLAGAAQSAPVAEPLTVLQASVGNVIHMVALDEVLSLEAADKYVRVLTAQHEYLIRTPLRDILPRLDPQVFWQVHRAHVVRARAIHTVTRDEAGKLWLQMHGRPGRIAVSRLYAQRFKAM